MDVFWNKKWRIKDTAKNLIRFWSPKLVGLQISCPFPFGLFFQVPTISFRRYKVWGRKTSLLFSNF